MIYPLINQINLSLPSGHIELWEDEGMIMYRNSELTSKEMSINQTEIDFILSSCLAECDKYYPSFQFVLLEKKSPIQALEASLINVCGEA